MSVTATALQLDPDSNSSSKYIIADLFPRRRVHLIVGPSGGGKTRWMFPMISEWIDGKPIFERKSYPIPCGYLACDRPAEAARETLESLQLPNMTPENFPIKSMMDIDGEFHFDVLPKLFDPKVKVIFVEALAALIPNGKINDYHSVLRFFKSLYRICTKNDLTIIGSVHQPKMREDEGFAHPRDKVLGSVAWAACSDTVILIEPENPKLVSSTRRRMTILPRNESHFEYQLDFDDLGRLRIVSGDTDTYSFLIEQELSSIAFDQFLSTSEIHEWGSKYKVPKRTMELWISNMVDSGKIERVKKGTYKKLREN